MSAELPQAVARFIARQGLTAPAMASVSFDPEFKLIGRNGALDELGLASLGDAELEVLLRDVCLGLSKLHGAPIAEITLPNLTACELHLIAENDRFHTLILDRRDQVQGVRVLQQAAQENDLKAQDRAKQLRAARAAIKQLSQERDALKVELLRASARLSLLAFAPPEAPLRPDALKAKVLAVLQPLALRLHVRLELTQAGASNAPLHELTAEMALGVPVFAIRQAMLRAKAGDTVRATIKCSADVLQVTVVDQAQALSESERRCIWESQAPEPAAGELALTLYALGSWCREGKGRVTVPQTNDLSITLIASVPREPEVTERIGPKRVSLHGQRIVILGEAEAWAERLVDAGAQVQSLALSESTIGVLVAEAPPAVLIRAGTAGALAKRLVFKLRAHGYAGVIIAISLNAPSGAAWWDYWLLEPLDLSALRQALPAPAEQK